MKSIYEQLSEERKKLQEKGDIPEWYTTMGWQMFKEKYSYKGETVKQAFERIAKTAAQYARTTPSWWEPGRTWEKSFFKILWEGELAPSTPVQANTGTDRGCSVSCSGGVIDDNIYDFYERRKEVALLSKHGFGTSSYLGNIRERGSSISSGGKASGIVPEFRGMVQVSRDVSQGGIRRGAWAGYLPIDHGDFWELAKHILKHPDDANVGWNISDSFIEKLEAGDEEAIKRFQHALKLKVVTGKGYFFFIDKVKRAQPQMYADQGLECKASNLCTEITLHSDDLETFTCVLSSLNLLNWDKIRDNDTIFVSTVFLDCIAQDFIEKGSDIRGLERAVRFTERHRALGLGALGFHSYLQKNMVALESFEAHMINNEIFSTIKKKAVEATKWMAKEWGEPEVCQGYGVRNTHLLAIAPNTSSALLCGSVSQGIEPLYQNAFVQGSAAGEMNRVNPQLIPLMESRGVYNDDTINRIIDKNGSVQQEGWLSEEEKLVFRTAFEIDQMSLIRLAAARQSEICQAQSLNLFFASDEDEGYIAKVHAEVFRNPNIKSLYYLRTLSGVKAAKETCLACEG